MGCAGGKMGGWVGVEVRLTGGFKCFSYLPGARMVQIRGMFVPAPAFFTGLCLAPVSPSYHSKPRKFPTPPSP